jgi:hypothetical protein
MASCCMGCRAMLLVQQVRHRRLTPLSTMIQISKQGGKEPIVFLAVGGLTDRFKTTDWKISVTSLIARRRQKINSRSLQWPLRPQHVMLRKSLGYLDSLVQEVKTVQLDSRACKCSWIQMDRFHFMSSMNCSFFYFEFNLSRALFIFWSTSDKHWWSSMPAIDRINKQREDSWTRKNGRLLLTTA